MTFFMKPFLPFRSVMAAAEYRSEELKYNDPDHNVIKLKFENHEKFTELVVSHLTRFLDLPGVQLDILIGEHSVLKENVGKLQSSGKRLWNPLKRKDSKSVGCALSDDNLMQIQQLTDFLGSNLTVEGIFRKPGNAVRQGQLQTALGTGANINFEKSRFHAHDAASVLKLILGQLSEPLLLPSQHFDAHVQISKMNRIDSNSQKTIPDKGKRIEALQLLLLLLPTNHRKVLRGVFDLLLQVAKHQKENKMNAANLAAMFTPHLIWPRSAKASEIHGSVAELNDHIAFMIRHSEKIFNAPPYVRQSANFYFPVDVSASPKVGPSALVAPSSAVKRTASERQRYQESAKVQTETAISELRTQVSNLPNSSKKKKLVKNFAKHEEVIKYQNKTRKRHRTLSGFMRKKSLAKSKAKEMHSEVSVDELRASSKTSQMKKSVSSTRLANLTSKTSTSHPSLTDRVVTRSYGNDSPKSPLLTGLSRRLKMLHGRNSASHSPSANSAADGNQSKCSNTIDIAAKVSTV